MLGLSLALGAVSNSARGEEPNPLPTKKKKKKKKESPKTSYAHEWGTPL
jgi:hypothetical protein